MAPVRRPPRLATAAALLTRLPLPARWVTGHPAEGVRWYPLVGALIGLVGAVAGRCAALTFPSAVAALVAIVVPMAVTGALHEDGLADVADALGAPRRREDALRILKDSRIGTFGAIALLSALAFRGAALLAIPSADWLLVLVAAHALGRAAMVTVVKALPPARPDGLGGVIHAGADGPALFVAAMFVTPAALCSPLSIPVAAFVTLAAVRFFRDRLGGYTGDCLGATCVVVELVVLVMATAAYG